MEIEIIKLEGYRAEMRGSCIECGKFNQDGSIIRVSVMGFGLRFCSEHWREFSLRVSEAQDNLASVDE
jgi:hypothetical protein